MLWPDRNFAVINTLGEYYKYWNNSCNMIYEQIYEQTKRCGGRVGVIIGYR